MHASLLSFKNFFETHFGVVSNKYGIQFSHFTVFQGVSADCSLPNFSSNDRTVSVCIAKECPSLQDFVNEFSLSSMNDLYKVTKEWMYQKYRQGKAEICCMINDYHAHHVYFRLEGSRMMVRDSRGIEQKLLQVLQSPEEMIRYAKINAGL
jgi:hypothetical protein